MKFIKSWKVFEAEEEITSDDITAVAPDKDIDKAADQTNKDAIEKLQKSLADFKQKSQSLGDIFKKTLNDEELAKELNDKIYINNAQEQGINRFLKEYENILRLNRRSEKAKIAISSDKSRKIDIQQNILDLKSTLSEVTDQEDRANVVNNINKNQGYLKKLDNNIVKKTKGMALDQTNFDKRLKDFQTQMQEEEKRIQNLNK